MLGDARTHVSKHQMLVATRAARLNVVKDVLSG